MGSSVSIVEHIDVTSISSNHSVRYPTKHVNELENIINDKLRRHLFLKFLDESDTNENIINKNKEVFECWNYIEKMNKMYIGTALTHKTNSFLKKFGNSESNSTSTSGSTSDTTSCNIIDILHLTDNEKKLLDNKNDLTINTENRVMRPRLYDWNLFYYRLIKSMKLHINILM